MGKHKNKARDLDKGKDMEEEDIRPAPAQPPSEGCCQYLQQAEDPSSTTSTSSDFRFNYLTYMSFEPNGDWGLLTIPFISPQNSSSVSHGVQIGQNDFLLISPGPADSPRARQQKEKGGSRRRHDDNISSSMSSTGTNSSELDNKNQASCSCTAGTTSNEFDRSKAEKKAERNAKKKARRKEKKRNEKMWLSNSAASTELEASSEEYCAPEHVDCLPDDSPEDGIRTILEEPEDNHVEELVDSPPAGHEIITEVNPSNLESKSVNLNSQEIPTHAGKKECCLDHQKCAEKRKRDKKGKRLPKNCQKRKVNNPSVWRKVGEDTVSCSEGKKESKAEEPRRLNLGEEQYAAVHNHSLPEHNKSIHPENESSSSDHDKLSTLKKSKLQCEGLCLRAASGNISEALNDSYRANQLSEALRLATGSPIAEFERMVNAATPVICPWKEVQSRSSCANEANPSLCINEIPKISLALLWKWYEEHGSYGLEVPSEDFSYSKTTGFHHLAFRAYFVPSLSAIQLFRNPNTGTSWPFETAEVAEDPELIFEYLESDQPQLRRPLYDQIKELIREGERSQNKMYGDPRNLDSMKLNKLHPRSWYAVAWYPIYRIPDGEHRACFLTFHSFTHLVRREKDSSAVCPVVGLLSYNARRWFHLKQFGASEIGGTLRLNHSEILKERVQTLERAACVMARGEVNKGNLKFVSRHPDHEFFLSRRPLMHLYN